MDRFWGKIGLGALGIFGLGMGGVTLAKKGIHELKTAAVDGPVQAALQNLPTDLLNFRLDGRRIGKVRSVDISHEDEWSSKSVVMTVALEANRAPDDLGDCRLATETMDRRKDASFRCVDSDEIADENLVEIGTVKFEPDAITRPLFIRERDVRKLNQSDVRASPPTCIPTTARLCRAKRSSTSRAATAPGIGAPSRSTPAMAGP